MRKSTKNIHTNITANYPESMIFTDEQLSRIQKRVSNERVTVIADLHGMQYEEAKRFLKNLIAVNRTPFTLDVIHGYNHGTVLKRMVSTEPLSTRVVNRQCRSYNLGLTELTVSA